MDKEDVYTWLIQETILRANRAPFLKYKLEPLKSQNQVILSKKTAANKTVRILLGWDVDRMQEQETTA